MITLENVIHAKFHNDLFAWLSQTGHTSAAVFSLPSSYWPKAIDNSMTQQFIVPAGKRIVELLRQ